MTGFAARNPLSSMRARIAESFTTARSEEQQRDEVHIRLVQADPATWARIYL